MKGIKRIERDDILSEGGRQLIHLIFGLAFGILIYYEVIGLKTIFFITIIGLLLSAVSLYVSIPLIRQILDSFDREETRKVFPGKGALMLMIGILLAVALFPSKIAAASIFILAAGDSFSTIIGKFYGKRKLFFNKKKTLEGLIAGFIAALVSTILIVPWYAALIASFVGAFFEAVNIKIFTIKIDDNIIIPVVSGIVLSILL